MSKNLTFLRAVAYRFLMLNAAQCALDLDHPTNVFPHPRV